MTRGNTNEQDQTSGKKGELDSDEDILTVDFKRRRGNDSPPTEYPAERRSTEDNNSYYSSMAGPVAQACPEQ